MKSQRAPPFKDPVISVWSLIQNDDGREIPIEELYNKLGEYFDREEIDRALIQLNKMYLIDYKKGENGVILTKKNILGELFEDIPCIGCEHLHECHVGGDRYAPENCEYINNWLRNIVGFL